MKKMCGGLFSFCFLHETVFGNGQVAITHNGGDWRSKSLALPLIFSTTLDGFYFANCVLAAVFFLFDFQEFRK